LAVSAVKLPRATPAAAAHAAGMFLQNYYAHAAATPPITPVAAPTPATASRSFQDYRYAIEAGLISPHHERCYIPAWACEQTQPLQQQTYNHPSMTPPSAAATAGAVTSRARAGKRYHTHGESDGEEDDASGMTCEYQGAVR
jgi:hypothetical protein